MITPRPSQPRVFLQRRWLSTTEERLAPAGSELTTIAAAAAAARATPAADSAGPEGAGAECRGGLQGEGQQGQQQGVHMRVSMCICAYVQGRVVCIVSFCVVCVHVCWYAYAFGRTGSTQQGR